MLKRHSGDRFASLLLEAQDCTSRNMHTESLIAIAKYFGNVEYNSDSNGDSFQYSIEFQDIECELRAIEVQHEAYGSITRQLRDQRTALYNRLMEIVGHLVTANELNALKGTM